MISALKFNIISSEICSHFFSLNASHINLLYCFFHPSAIVITKLCCLRWQEYFQHIFLSHNPNTLYNIWCIIGALNILLRVNWINVLLEWRYRVYISLWKFRCKRNINFNIFLSHILNQIKSYPKSPSYWADSKFDIVITGDFKSRKFMWCPVVGNQEKGPGFNSIMVTWDFSTVQPTCPGGRWFYYLCQARTGDLCWGWKTNAWGSAFLYAPPAFPFEILPSPLQNSWS